MLGGLEGSPGYLLVLRRGQRVSTTRNKQSSASTSTLQDNYSGLRRWRSIFKGPNQLSADLRYG